MSYSYEILEHLKGRKFNSILEIGCGQGQNLEMIRKEFPKVKIAGCDIIDDKLLDSVKKKCKYCDITSKIPYQNKSFDIVFTAAVLLFFSDEMAEKIMKDIKKIARKEVFFIEMHSEKEKSTRVIEEDWHRNRVIRDYKKLLKGFHNISFVKIEKWPGKNNCKDCGYLISAKI